MAIDISGAAFSILSLAFKIRVDVVAALTYSLVVVRLESFLLKIKIKKFLFFLFYYYDKLQCAYFVV